MNTRLLVALALALAAVVALYASLRDRNSASPQKCPITGVVLTEEMLADPSLKVGNATMCCQGCVKTYRDQMRYES